MRAAGPQTQDWPWEKPNFQPLSLKAVSLGVSPSLTRSMAPPVAASPGLRTTCRMPKGHWVSLAAFICQNWTLVRDTVHPAKASRGRRVISVGNGLCCSGRVTSILFAVSLRPARLYLTGSGRNVVIRRSFTQTAFGGPQSRLSKESRQTSIRPFQPRPPFPFS